MIVVDANIVVYWAIDGQFTLLARELRQREPDWIAPMLCRHELANVVASYIRHGAMDADDIDDLWRNICLLIDRAEAEVDLVRAIGLAVELGISAYDAQYVLLSMTQNVPLVTQDRKLAAKYANAISLARYLELPPAR